MKEIGGTMTKNKNIPQGYKDSPLGVIPKEWEVKRLGDLVKIKSGESPNLFNLSNTGKYPYVKVEDMNNCEKFQMHSREYSNDEKSIIPQWSVIFPKRGAAILNNKVRIAGTDIQMDSNMMAIMPLQNSIISEYLYYRIICEQLFKIADTSTIPQINNKHIIPYKLCLPPLPEQQKIAETLSIWDEAIDVQTRLIASLQTRKRGLMQQLLTGKKRVKGFSGKWEEKPLEEMVGFYNGKAHENNLTENGVFILVNSKFISTEGKVIKRTDSCLSPLFKEDIVMVMSDVPNGKAIAKCYYIEEDNKYTLNQRICVLRTKKGYKSKFMFYAINRNKYYLLYDDGVKQTNLRKEEVLDCPIFTPEYKEQTAIANILSAADTEIELALQKLAKLKEQKKGLMQVLLTGKKRVKI